MTTRFGKTCDLLCVWGKKRVRLPFVVGRFMSPIGIFPCKGDDRYLELEETGETLRNVAEENRLPPESFCEKVFAVQDEVNRCLALLHAPLLQGEYFAKGEYLQDVNWIVVLGDDNAETLPSDYYEDSETAKVRYFGTL